MLSGFVTMRAAFIGDRIGGMDREKTAVARTGRALLGQTAVPVCRRGTFSIGIPRVWPDGGWSRPMAGRWVIHLRAMTTRLPRVRHFAISSVPRRCCRYRCTTAKMAPAGFGRSLIATAFRWPRRPGTTNATLRVGCRTVDSSKFCPPARRVIEIASAVEMRSLMVDQAAVNKGQTHRCDGRKIDHFWPVNDPLRLDFNALTCGFTAKAPLTSARNSLDRLRKTPRCHCRRLMRWDEIPVADHQGGRRPNRASTHEFSPRKGVDPCATSKSCSSGLRQRHR